jgi:hypothetical protein
VEFRKIAVIEGSEEHRLAIAEAEMALSRAERRYERAVRALVKEQADLRRRREKAAAIWENERSTLEEMLKRAKDASSRTNK